MAERKKQFIIGIDEVGRGPLAGPVVVGGVMIATRNKRQAAGMLRGIKDSKKLSAKQREEWFAKLTAHREIVWAVARVESKTIDRINISHAANLGALRVYKKFRFENIKNSSKKFFILNATACRIGTFSKRDFGGVFDDTMETVALLDGGLRLPAHIRQKTIIRGDEKIPVIAAASIIAKVTRDRMMARLHKKYPRYRFDIHKGYGTALHRAMIKKYGRSEAHRKSFHIRNQE